MLDVIAEIAKDTGRKVNREVEAQSEEGEVMDSIGIQHGNHRLFAIDITELEASQLLFPIQIDDRHVQALQQMDMEGYSDVLREIKSAAYDTDMVLDMNLDEAHNPPLLRAIHLKSNILIKENTPLQAQTLNDKIQRLVNKGIQIIEIIQTNCEDIDSGGAGNGITDPGFR